MISAEREKIDLCIEILNAMTRLEFKEDSIDMIERHQNFVEATTSNPYVQRTQLTMAFFDVMMNGKSEEPVPSKIRMALNYSPNVEGWLDDMKLVILPFLKRNEENFF